MDDHRRRASLEVLRAEAQDELGTVVHERLRAGEDPWAFMDELLTVDELVVLSLRAESILEDGGRRPSPDRDYLLLREIAIAYPELTAVVWHLIGRIRPEQSHGSERTGRSAGGSTIES